MSRPARIVTGREPFVTQIGFWTLVLPILAILGVLILAAREGAPATIELERPSSDTMTEIIFAGEADLFAAAGATAFHDLALFQQDAFVFGGGESPAALEGAVAAAQQHAGLVLAADNDHQGWYQVNDVVAIVLDVAMTEDGSCGLNQTQLDMLREAVKTSAAHRILFMDHALWAHSGYVDTLQPENPVTCVGDYWQEQVLPIIEGEVALVVSGDGGNVTPFGVAERGDIRYVLTGTAAGNASSPALITMARIQARGGQLLADRLTIGASENLDAAVLDEVPTYTVTAAEADLEQLYRTAPFYDYGTDWQLKIEPDSVLSWLQDPIEATLETQAGPVPVGLAIRGNVGNHWETYKKSWDIDFIDTDDRQVKLIKPSDRGYLNQVFVQHMSDWLGVPTPDIDVVRLIVNNHDFGIYLRYEDFDRAFIELSGYGSDTQPAKNSFRDHFDAYAVTEELSRIAIAGGTGDRSDQQAVVTTEFTPENMAQFFEQDIFARWLALQMFLGDRHQSEEDNFRFFLDRSTGRYVMVNWDSSVSVVNPEEVMTGAGLIATFYANADNAALTDQYVRELVAAAPQFREHYRQLVSDNLPILTNDAALEIPPAILEASLAGLLAQFDANVAALEGF